MTGGHRILYIVLGAAFLLTTGVALVAYHQDRETERAQELAAQLTGELSAAGLRTPAAGQIARVLGDDGGAVCASPGAALRRGVLYGMLTNGAAGPGQRPVIAENKALQGQVLIIKVYCPQYLEEIREIVDDLKLTVTTAG